MVTLVVGGSPIDLAAQERSQIAAQVRALFAGCGATSVTSPAMFAGRAFSTEWTETRAGPHLHVRFSQPLARVRDGMLMSEALVGLQHAEFIGPELSRSGDGIVGHVKCDGHRSLALMCATALRPRLAATQARHCQAYERLGPPRDSAR